MNNIEEAAEKYATISRNININEQGIYQAGIRAGFKEGAKWQSKQPLDKELQEKIDMVSGAFKAAKQSQSVKNLEESVRVHNTFYEQSQQPEIKPDEDIQIPDIGPLINTFLPSQFDLSSFKHKEILFLKSAFQQGAQVMFYHLKNTGALNKKQ